MVSNSLDLPENAHLFNDEYKELTWIYTNKDLPEEKLDRKIKRLEVFPIKTAIDGKLALKEILASLPAKSIFFNG